MALAISSGRKAIALQPHWRLGFAIQDAAAPDIATDSDQMSLLLTRSKPPQSSFEDLQHFRDIELWEIPCFSLSSVKAPVPRGRLESPELVCAVEAALADVGLGDFDVLGPVEKVQQLVSVPLRFCSLWRLLKEPDFGPKHPVNTAIVVLRTARLDDADDLMWFDISRARNLLQSTDSDSGRIGFLAANLFYSCFPKGVLCELKPNVEYQEYPPGMLTIPMASRTLRPFSKTNLVVWAPASHGTVTAEEALVADALIVDPGCSAPRHNELAAIVTALPRKLAVFITHHHLDHAEGLPAVKEANAGAIVLAHPNTLKRLGSQLAGCKSVAVDGGTKILLKGHMFEVIASPGHTDGHLCLFHSATHTLVAGDHCVGEGSSILDPNSGGNLHDYMATSYRLLELRPQLIVPMHGRPSLWPIHLLKSYIRHRQTREAQILAAIENGATTLFGIVSNVYKQTPISLWPAAVLNVKSHVEHLRVQGKLPKDFSFQKFERSCGVSFSLRLMVRVVYSFLQKAPTLGVCVVILAFFLFWFQKSQLSSRYDGFGD